MYLGAQRRLVETNLYVLFACLCCKHFISIYNCKTVFSGVLAGVGLVVFGALAASRRNNPQRYSDTDSD